MPTYEEVRKDWETLWNIAPAYDMTGGYVDQEDLELMLKNPTKRTAAECMENQIRYWFEVGPEIDSDHMVKAEQYIESDESVRAVAEKYGYA